MRQSSLFYTVVLLAMLVCGVYSCKKINGIDNNSVVQTPFSLYFTDTSGRLMNSVDGKTITQVLFSPDGKPSRSLVVFQSKNILWAKDNLYISLNEGQNFNHSYDSLTSMKIATCAGDSSDLNQSMLYNIDSWNNCYAMSSAPLIGSQNYFGLAFNDSFGYRGHWKYDGTYDTVGDMGILPVRAFSMTQLKNGVACFLAFHTDGVTIRNMWAFQDAGWVRWHEKTANPLALPNVGGLDQSGTPLPTGSLALPTHYTLGHLNNRLIAVDGSCHYKSYYSDDTGKNWLPCQGLPSVPQLCVASPFEQDCFVGTRGQGLYILNLHTNTFEPNNNGLASNLIVRNIVGKQVIYKNGNVQKYIYLATNKGIYQSTDGGRNFTLTIAGNYVTIY